VRHSRGPRLTSSAGAKGRGLADRAVASQCMWLYMLSCCRRGARLLRSTTSGLIRMLFDWLVIGQVMPTNPGGVGSTKKR
jgi:hypothetical protein